MPLSHPRERSPLHRAPPCLSPWQFSERRILLPLFTIDNQVNKQGRIRRLTPYLAGGRIRFKAQSPGARLLVKQLRDFPHADHDDGPDALEMALRLANELLDRSAPEEPEVIEIVVT